MQWDIVYDNILQTIGNTPVVRINKLAPPHVQLFAKVESFNPMGSVKDRLALGVIEDAERRGELQPGQTSGGGLQRQHRHWPCHGVRAEGLSAGHHHGRELQRRAPQADALPGRRVVLTPASEKGSGMVAKARELADTHGWWRPRQFENPANAETHARTTAGGNPARLRRPAAGLLGHRLRHGGHARPAYRGCCRQQSPAHAHRGVRTGQLAHPGQRHRAGAQCRRLGARQPSVVPAACDAGLVAGFHSADRRRSGARARASTACLAINGNDAMRCARDLARQEGIFVGTSSGATLAGALQVARGTPRRAAPSCACCRTPASAT